MAKNILITHFTKTSLLSNSMATLARLLPTPYSSSRILLKANPDLSSRFSKSSFINKFQTSALEFKQRCTLFTKAIANLSSQNVRTSEKVFQVHSIEEFDEALLSAENRLVIAHFIATGYNYNGKICNSMAKLSADFQEVIFLTVKIDESEKAMRLCKRENVEKIPHFIFYKNKEKIHEERSGFGADRLVNDILYYGDNHSLVIQVHSRQEVEKLVKDHEVDQKLIVLNIGLKQCGPCAKVYRTVLKLSSQMMSTTVFARMNGDENQSCMEFLKEMDVVKVPTFLFLRNGAVRGSYVGSCRCQLIREIAKYAHG